MTHATVYFDEVQQIARAIDPVAVSRLAASLAGIRDAGGRLFILGVGGSAGNAGHAVNDFRKLCSIEAYAPTDNVPELTARTNDEGWETVFSEWLKVSRICHKDGVLVFSVGGGNAERNVSMNIVAALDTARQAGAKIFGVVGRDGGHTKKVGDEVIVVPTVAADRVTPHTEAFHAVVWHCLVSDPVLQTSATKW